MKCRVKAIPVQSLKLVERWPKLASKPRFVGLQALLHFPSLDRLMIETYGSLPEVHSSQLVIVDGVGVDEGSEFAVETIRTVNLSSVMYGGQTK